MTARFRKSSCGRCLRRCEGSEHRFRYSLFFGIAGERWVGYDNEPGKGDHRHYDAREELYAFSSPEQLIADFLADVAAEQARRKAGRNAT